MAYADFLSFPDRAPTLPAWFAEPRVLSLDRHAGLGVRRSGNLRFAATIETAPLALSEFGAAMRCYPICFTNGDTPTPVAVMALEKGRNLFVDALGGWRRDHHVPSCLSRYPLVALAGHDGKIRLYADFSSGRLVQMRPGVDEDVDPIFEESGGLSSFGKSSVIRSQLAERSLADSAELGRALAEAGVLTPSKAPGLGDAGQALRDGLLCVDEGALNALPAALLAEFARRGWLEPIVLSIVSRQNWHALAQMTQRYNPTGRSRAA